MSSGTGAGAGAADDEPKESQDVGKKSAAVLAEKGWDEFEHIEEPGQEVQCDIHENAVMPVNYVPSELDDYRLTVNGKEVVLFPSNCFKINGKLVAQPNNTGKPSKVKGVDGLPPGRTCGEDKPKLPKDEKHFRTPEMVKRYGPNIEIGEKGEKLFATYMKVAVPDPPLCLMELGRIRAESAWFCITIGEWCQRVDFFDRNKDPIRPYLFVYWPLSRLVLAIDLPRPLGLDGRVTILPNKWPVSICTSLKRNQLIAIGGVMHRISFNWKNESAVFARPCQAKGDNCIIVDMEGYSEADWPLYYYSDFDTFGPQAENLLNMLVDRMLDDARKKKKQLREDKKRQGLHSAAVAAAENEEAKGTSHALSSPGTSGSGIPPRGRRRKTGSLAQATAKDDLVQAFLNTQGDDQQKLSHEITPPRHKTGDSAEKLKDQPESELIKIIGDQDIKLLCQGEELRSWRSQNEARNKRENDQARSWGKKMDRMEAIKESQEKMVGRLEDVVGKVDTMLADQKEHKEATKSTLFDAVKTAVRPVVRDAVNEELTLKHEEGYWKNILEVFDRRSRSRTRGHHEKRHRHRRRSSSSSSSSDSQKTSAPKKKRASSKASRNTATPAESVEQRDSTADRRSTSPEATLIKIGPLAVKDRQTQAERFGFLDQKNGSRVEYPPVDFDPEHWFWQSQTFGAYTDKLEDFLGIDIDKSDEALLKAKMLCRKGYNIDNYSPDRKEVLETVLDDVLDDPDSTAWVSHGGKKTSPSGSDDSSTDSDLEAAAKRKEESKKRKQQAAAAKKDESTPEPEEPPKEPSPPPQPPKKKKHKKVAEPEPAKAHPFEAALSKSDQKVAEEAKMKHKKSKEPTHAETSAAKSASRALAAAVKSQNKAKPKPSTPVPLGNPVKRKAETPAAACSYPKRKKADDFSSDDEGDYPNDGVYKTRNAKVPGELNDAVQFNQNLLKGYFYTGFEDKIKEKAESGARKLHTKTSMEHLKFLVLQFAQKVVKDQRCPDIKGRQDMHNQCLRSSEILRNCKGFRSQYKQLRCLPPLYGCLQKALEIRSMDEEGTENGVKTLVQHICHNIRQKNLRDEKAN